MTKDEQLTEALNIISLFREGAHVSADRMNRLLNAEFNEDEPDQKEEVECTYGIQVGRNARAYFLSQVQGKLSEIKEHATRHGYAGSVLGGWKEDGLDTFDSTEVIYIFDLNTQEPIMRWTQGDGWEEIDENV